MANPNIHPGQGGVTFPSPNEFPVTYRAITGITRSLQATITAPNHGITISSTASTPKVDFSQVKGMFQINGQFGFVTSIVDADNFTVALNTLQYSAYISGGYANITGGIAPYDPFENIYP
jgi:hypothetical protein